MLFECDGASWLDTQCRAAVSTWRSCPGRRFHRRAGAVRLIADDFWIINVGTDGGVPDYLYAHFDLKGKLDLASFDGNQLDCDPIENAIFVGDQVIGPMTDTDFVRIRAQINKARKVLAAANPVAEEAAPASAE